MIIRLNLPYLYCRLGTLNICFVVKNVMVRTHSRLRNYNGNQQPELQVIERVPEVATAPEPITLATIHAMLDRHMEETIRLLQ